MVVQLLVEEDVDVLELVKELFPTPSILDELEEPSLIAAVYVCEW